MPVDIPGAIGVVSPAEQRRAEKQAAKLDKINHYSNAFVLRYAQAIKSAAIAAYKSGNKLNIPIESIVEELTGFAVLAYLFGVKDYPESLDPELNLASTYDKQIKKIAKGFSINIGKLSEQLTKTVAPNVRNNLHNVRKQINKSLSEISGKQLSTNQGIALLNTRLKSMGVTPNSRGYVESLVRTHGQMSYNAAQGKAFERNTAIWGYKYVTVGDSRVRPAHAKLHGMVRIKGDKIWQTVWPPNGWNCRCQVLAIYANESDAKVTRLPYGTAKLIDEEFRFNPTKEIF